MKTKMMILLVLVATATLFIASCNEDNTPVTSNQSNSLDQRDVIPASPGADDEIDTTRIRFIEDGVEVKTCSDRWIKVINASISMYNAKSDTEATNYIDHISQMECMQMEIETFEAEGFELRFDLSYVVEGMGIPEGTSDTFNITVTDICMVHQDWDSNGKEAYIRYTKSDGRADVVQTSVLAFKDPVDPTYECIYLNSDNGDVPIWIRDDVPHLRYRTQLAPLFNWWAYRNCVIKGTIAGCATAAVVCTAAGPGYGACVAAGCSSAFVGSVVACALDQLL